MQFDLGSVECGSQDQVATEVAPVSARAAGLLWRLLCSVHPACSKDNMLMAFESQRSGSEQSISQQYQQLGVWSRVLSATTSSCSMARKRMKKHHKQETEQAEGNPTVEATDTTRTFQDFYLETMSKEFEADIEGMCKGEDLAEAAASALIDNLEAGINIFEPLEKGIKVESLKRPCKF
eukprot:TRINITY_DN7219_c0_g2_i12.p1 TRINITY_DN7219_c0_g2~~TRINITY_DN7219_c0_g2_i12.p1  ORF type:complete len:179 (+),score=42.92 TRINITY_DN7219_c0_g2_i12:190-726(+)